MIEIIPTYVPHDEMDLAAGIKKIRTIASSIHVDVDDGIFAPHVTWPYEKDGALGEVKFPDTERMFVEMHIMAEEPKEAGLAFVRAGASRIIGHVEGFADAEEARAALAAWKSAGAREVGLGLLFQTPFEVIDSLVAHCDVVHMMSIASIGVQGIAYEPTAPARIVEFHQRFPETLISVDGGVSEKNIADLTRAGATRFGVGSAISKAADPKSAYENLKTLAENAIQ